MGVSEQVESGDRWRVRFLPTAPTLVLVLTSPQLGLSTCVSNRGALDGGRYQQDTNTNTKTNTTISDQSPKIPTTVSGYPINTSVSNRLHSKEENIRSLVTLWKVLIIQCWWLLENVLLWNVSCSTILSGSTLYLSAVSFQSCFSIDQDQNQS